MSTITVTDYLAVGPSSVLGI